MAIDVGVDSVIIGLDRIVVGYETPHSIEFSYKRSFDDDAAVEMLELCSLDARPNARLIFKKLDDCPESLETRWSIGGPELFRKYQHDYELLKYRHLNGKVNLKR